MLREDGRLDHRPVPRQDAGVVGDEKRATCGGHVLDPSSLHPPVVAVQSLEQNQKRLSPFGVEAEIVDRVVGTPPCKLALLVDELHDRHEPIHVDDVAPGHVSQARGQVADSLERIHRRLALQAADLLGQSQARSGRRRDDTGLAAAASQGLAVCGSSALSHHFCTVSAAPGWPFRASLRRRWR